VNYESIIFLPENKKLKKVKQPLITKNMEITKIDLVNLDCQEYKEGTPPMDKSDIQSYISNLQPGWVVINDYKINKEFTFKNYNETVDFVNKVAQIADKQQHHPVQHVYFNKVIIELWTHSVNGLSQNDFIMAAKIDSLK
jgi:4a-hydroxytetrahydrobiopterin dehydratase